MTEQNRDDETRPLPVADETQQLPTGEPDRPLESEAGDTRRLPITDDTQAPPPPRSGRADDPLSVFDEPRTTAADRTAPEPAATETTTVRERSGPRTATIVWGFLVVALGLGLLADAAGAQVDVELAAIVLLAIAGVVLVVGSVLGAVRRRRS